MDQTTTNGNHEDQAGAEGIMGLEIIAEQKESNKSLKASTIDGGDGENDASNTNYGSGDEDHENKSDADGTDADQSISQDQKQNESEKKKKRRNRHRRNKKKATVADYLNGKPLSPTTQMGADDPSSVAEVKDAGKAKSRSVKEYAWKEMLGEEKKPSLADIPPAGPAKGAPKFCSASYPTLDEPANHVSINYILHEANLNAMCPNHTNNSVNEPFCNQQKCYGQPKASTSEADTSFTSTKKDFQDAPKKVKSSMSKEDWRAVVSGALSVSAIPKDDHSYVKNLPEDEAEELIRFDDGSLPIPSMEFTNSNYTNVISITLPEPLGPHMPQAHSVEQEEEECLKSEDYSAEDSEQKRQNGSCETIQIETQLVHSSLSMDEVADVVAAMMKLGNPGSVYTDCTIDGHSIPTPTDECIENMFGQPKASTSEADTSVTSTKKDFQDAPKKVKSSMSKEDWRAVVSGALSVSAIPKDDHSHTVKNMREDEVEELIRFDEGSLPIPSPSTEFTNSNDTNVCSITLQEPLDPNMQHSVDQEEEECLKLEDNFPEVREQQLSNGGSEMSETEVTELVDSSLHLNDVADVVAPKMEECLKPEDNSAEVNEQQRQNEEYEMSETEIVHSPLSPFTLNDVAEVVAPEKEECLKPEDNSAEVNEQQRQNGGYEINEISETELVHSPLTLNEVADVVALKEEECLKLEDNSAEVNQNGGCKMSETELVHSPLSPLILNEVSDVVAPKMEECLKLENNSNSAEVSKQQHQDEGHVMCETELVYSPLTLNEVADVEAPEKEESLKLEDNSAEVSEHQRQNEGYEIKEISETELVHSPLPLNEVADVVAPKMEECLKLENNSNSAEVNQNGGCKMSETELVHSPFSPLILNEVADVVAPKMKMSDPETVYTNCSFEDGSDAQSMATIGCIEDMYEYGNRNQEVIVFKPTTTNKKNSVSEAAGASSEDEDQTCCGSFRRGRSKTVKAQTQSVGRSPSITQRLASAARRHFSRNPR